MPINIRDTNLTCIAADPEEPDILYIGTVSRLYKSLDNGLTWQVVFRCMGEQKGINDIFIASDSTIYIATKNGIYKSSDYGAGWKRVFKGETFEKKYIRSITARSDKECFYVLTFSNLYEIRNNGLSWKKIFIGGIEDNENDDEEETIKESATLLKKIAIDGKNNLYLSTSKSILTSCDGGKNWNRMNETGLSNRDINFCLVSKIDSNKIYAATENGVFQYLKDAKIWRNIYQGLESTKIKSLSFNSKNEDFILCLADNNIYKTVEKKDYLKILYSNFNNEPSIRETQELAIMYAEVHPDKIRKWRNGAKLRGLLPKVTFGIDHSRSDTIKFYSDPSDFWIYGPLDKTEGWDLTFTWDMGDFIYNEHQTTIDIRSKLMAQLREGLLNDLTRLYFERRRLQMELAAKKPATEIQKIEKELRLEELTASIDALTGGKFSEVIEAERNYREKISLHQ